MYKIWCVLQWYFTSLFHHSVTNHLTQNLVCFIINSQSTLPIQNEFFFFFGRERAKIQKEKELQVYTNTSRHPSPGNIIKKETWNPTRRSFLTLIWKESREKLKLASQSALLFPSRYVWLKCTCQFNFKSSWMRFTKVGVLPLKLTVPMIISTNIF